MLVMLFCGVANADYTKVTSTEDITNGQYLIVYEDGNVAFNGALTTLDAESNTVAVTISDNKIASTEAIDAAVFNIDVTNGKLQAASGKYIGVSGNSNGLKQADAAATYSNTFAIDDNGNAVITANFSGSTMTLRYNSASNQARFRYYKNSGQQAIQLYKKVEAAPQPDTWTVVGEETLTGANWSETNTANDMTQIEGTTLWKLTKNVTLTAGSYKFKVAKNHAWTESYGDPNNTDDNNNKVLVVDADGTYDVTFWYNTDGNAVYATYAYSIRGDFWASWDVVNDMTKSATNDNIYTLVVENFIAEAKAYNYKQSANHTWGVYEIPATGNQTWNCEEAGIYTLTFTLNLAENTLALETVKTGNAPIANYSVDFNEAIDVSEGFRAAPGWLHKVYKPGYGNPIAYEYQATSGKDGSGCIYVPYNSGDDLLVTPEVSGTVTIDVKTGVSWSKRFNVYKVTVDETGNIVKGDEVTLTPAASNLSTDEFTTLTMTIDEPTRLGLKGYYSYIDNFSASSATIVLQKELTITAREGTTGWLYPNVTAEGTFPVSLKVTVKNTGEVDLSSADANYTVSLVKQGTTEPLLTADIPQALAIGEDVQVELSGNLNYADFKTNIGESARLDAMENISGSTITGDWIKPNPYEPKFAFRNESGEVAANSSYSFGMISQNATVSYTIRNGGAAPLTVNSITVPAGYQLGELTFPLQVAAGADQAIEITLPATTPGSYAGNVEVKYLDKDAVEQTFTLALSGIVLDPAKWFADFEDEKVPSGALMGESWDVANVSINYNYFKCLTNGNSSTPTFFVTPKLHATANEAMQFDVYGRSYGSTLNVKYSTDRQTWKPLTELTVGDAGITNGGWKTFTVNIPEDGDFYIGFEAGYIYLDNIYGLVPVAVAHDIFFTPTLPTEGMVNHDLDIKATILNTLATSETGWTLKYYVGETVAKEFEATELKQNVAQNLKAVYTPYTAGTFQTKLVLKLADETEYTSGNVELVVAEEVASSVVAVGSATSTISNGKIPFDTNYGYSQTETVYTAEEMAAAGLSAGTKITSIGYKGYRTAPELSAPITMWAENYEPGTAESTGTTFATVSDGIKIASGNITIPKAGSSSSMVDLFSIPVDITYTGGNFRIMSQSEVGGGGSSATNFQVFSGTGTSKYREIDNQMSSLLSASFSSIAYKPVLYLGIEKAASTFNGVLKMDDNGTETAVANATITLTNGNTKYSGTTDAEGNFNFNVLQDTKTYDITITGVETNFFPMTDVQKTVVFTGKSVTKNITLKAAHDFYINSVTAPAEGKVGVEYVATVTATNYNTTAMAATDYTAKLFINDAEVAAAEESVEIASMAEQTFTFKWTPTTAGDFTGYVKLQATQAAQTEPFAINVEDKHNVTVEFSTIPDAGMVNSEIATRVKVKNTLRAAEAADSYTLKLYAGDEVVAEATPELLEDYAKYFNLNFTPHAAGNISVVAKVEFTDGTIFASDAKQIAVAAEELVTRKVVSEGSITERSGAPVATWYKNSMSEMVYLKDQIGMPANTNFTSLIFKVSGSQTIPMQVWIANTENAAPASNEDTPVSTEGMTQVLNSEAVALNNGDFVINFTEPFTYTGNNLRIYVESLNGGGSGNASFYKNSNTNQAVVRKSDQALTSNNKFSAIGLPALTLGYEAAPTTFKGVLSINKKDQTSAVVAGATVTLTSDNVQYSGTTDADGKYEFDVLQNQRTYDISVSGVAETCFPLKDKAVFEGASIEQNITLTEAQGFYFANINAPAEATVNNAYTVVAEVTNYEATAQTNYAPTLYVGEEAVATAEAVEIAAGETKEFTFTYTPHAAGEATAHLQFGTNVSENFNFTIGNELVEKNVTVGTAGASNATSTAVYWMDAENGTKTDFYYSPAMLEAYNVAVGDKITGIKIAGNLTSSKELTATLDVWVGLQDETTFEKGNVVKENMRHFQIYNNESVSLTTKYELVLDMKDNPLVVEAGKSIRIYTELDGHSAWAGVSYPADGNYPNSYSQKGSNNWSTGTAVPVAIFSIDDARTMSGTVKNASEEAISGATVELTSGDVLYTATTDAEGAYTMTIAQTALTYTATVKAQGYLDAVEENISFAEGNVEKNFTLNTPAVAGEISGTVTDAATSAAIAGATVTLTTEGADPVEATTDVDGKYVFLYVESEKTYTINVAADGYYAPEAATVDLTSGATEVKNFALTAKAYSTSINIEQMVLAQTKKFDIAAALTEHNIAFENINELDSLNDAKNLRNEPFLGLKVKTAGGFIKVLLQKGKALNVKLGCINDPVDVAIDGVVDAEKQIAANTVGDSFTLAAAEVDREVTFTTTTAKTVVFKQIMIGEEIAAVTLPAQEFAITKTAATNGTYTVKVNDAEVEKATEGTVVTIAATPAEGYELDAIKVMNGETEVTVNGDGTFTMPAAAVTITVTFKQTVVDGIFGIKADGTVDGEAYTLDGVRIEKLQKGKVNIIRTKDGKIRRIFVK